MVDEFAKKIREEMLSDNPDALERNFGIAKQFVKLTGNGRVEVLPSNITGKDRILLYLIGKLYAKRAGLSSSEYVTTKEIMEELNIPRGSAGRWLGELQKTPGIKSVRKNRERLYFIPSYLVGRVLENIKKKVKESRKVG